MLILIDTSALYGDPLLERPYSQLLVSASRDGDVQLVVPELVIREAIKVAYGSEHSAQDDLAAMRRGFGAWQGCSTTGAAYVQRLRSGRRLKQR